MREERRIVTALFADIVGSTTIAERLDPEDAREVLGGTIERVIEQVDALGGTIKDLAGDGVLALFGAPVAHEDDAERAILCGLRIVEAIADHATEVAERWGVEGFSVRVGIETGRAVMGPVGGGSRIEYGATGDVLNTAARLQAHAEPGTVLVGAATRAMVEARFTWGETRALELKGKEQPVDAAPALAYLPRHRPTPRSTGVRLVGRASELALLGSALRDASEGQGSIVVLVGEAGVGKSRLVEEARELASSEGSAWLEAGGSSYGASIPYLLYRNLFLAWLGLPLSAHRHEVEAAIDARISGDPPAVGDALRGLLPTLVGARDEDADPESVQERVFAAATALVRGLAAEDQLTLVLEDLHWCDPTSISLTERMAALAAGSPILVLLTTRPEPAALEAVERVVASVPERTIRLDLPPLSRDGDRELLRALLDGVELPRSLEERILDTTDGNPFFVEEQVRALAAAGAVVRSDGSRRFVGASELELAPTVERALVARIDRLRETERRTLLAAAVLGVRFDGSLVGTLLEADPSPALSELDRLELVAPSGDAGAFRFRHALVQEAAYASLLRRERRVLHGRAAAALEARYEGRTDEIAGTLGHHLAEAGEADRAVDYLLAAARAAAGAYANEEAATLARDARALLPRIDGAIAEPWRETGIELSTIAGTAMRFLARYEASLAAYRDVLPCLTDEERVREARVRSTIGQILVDAHRYEDALAELEVAEAAVGEGPADPEAFQVWLDIQMTRGSVYYWMADIEGYSAMLRRVEPMIEARASRRQRTDFYDSVRAVMWRRDRFVISDELLRLDRMVHEEDRQSEDEEVRAWAAFQHGFTSMWHRDLDEAEVFLDESLDGARRIGDALLRARSLTYLMVTARLRGDVQAADRLVATVREAAVEAALPEYEAMASATAAWVAYRKGDPEVVRSQGRCAIETWAALPNRYPIDWMAALPLLAVALDRSEAEEAGRWAETMLAETQQPFPEQLRSSLQAGIDASSADATLATRWFIDAVERAAELGYL